MGGKRKALERPERPVEQCRGDRQYKVTPTEAHHQKVAALGGKLHSKMDFIKGAHYTVPASALQTLANDPDVAYITPDRAIQPSFDQITDGTVYSNVVNSSGYNGAGVGVAIIDSGIADCQIFTTARPTASSTSSPLSGHTGRSVRARHACGRHSRQRQRHRVHRNRTAGQHHQPSRAGCERQRHGLNVIAAIQTAISLQSQYNIRVINLSLGRPVYEVAALDPL